MKFSSIFIFIFFMLLLTWLALRVDPADANPIPKPAYTPRIDYQVARWLPPPI